MLYIPYPLFVFPPFFLIQPGDFRPSFHPTYPRRTTLPSSTPFCFFSVPDRLLFFFQHLCRPFSTPVSFPTTPVFSQFLATGTGQIHPNPHIIHHSLFPHFPIFGPAPTASQEGQTLSTKRRLPRSLPYTLIIFFFRHPNICFSPRFRLLPFH